MLSSLGLFFTLVLATGQPVQSKCEQAVPAPVDGKWTRTPQRTQAVVLIHGYYLHLQDQSVPRPEFRPWQRADSPLVKELAKHADVYLFAYGQNADVDTIVKESKLGENIAQLRKLGYSEIILVGHSAGGLIARHFVEDNPDAGVTKVVQVCAPNAGSPLATVKGHKSQQPFLDCLTEEGRAQCLKAREAKQIPAKVQFVCVIARGDATSGTDGVVPCVSQWTDDLRKQGIPAVAVTADHRSVVRDAKIVETLSGIIHADQPRWSTERIEQARKEIFGK